MIFDYIIQYFNSIGESLIYCTDYIPIKYILLRNGLLAFFILFIFTYLLLLFETEVIFQYVRYLGISVLCAPLLGFILSFYFIKWLDMVDGLFDILGIMIYIFIGVITEDKKLKKRLNTIITISVILLKAILFILFFLSYLAMCHKLMIIKFILAQIIAVFILLVSVKMINRYGYQAIFWMLLILMLPRSEGGSSGSRSLGGSSGRNIGSGGGRSIGSGGGRSIGCGRGR